MQKSYEQVLHSRYSDDEIKMFDSQFVILVQNTLNKLEAVCMNISSNAAGSQYIYPSLHQIFLRDMYLLSPYIAESNHDSIDKFFINIIKVYNMWKAEHDSDYKKQLKSQEKLNKLRKKQDKEIKKLLTKNPRTV